VKTKVNLNRNLAFWLIQIVFWTIYFFYEIHFVYSKAKTNIDFALYLLLMVYFGLLLSSVLRYVYKKIQDKWNSRSLLIVFVVLCSALLSFVWVIEVSVLDKLLSLKGYSVTPSTFYFYFKDFFSGFILLLFWSSLYLAFKLWENWEASNKIALTVEELKTQKLEAELNALKTQLNPHFLFNVLNSIYSNSLMKSDITPSIVLRLSDLMSYILYDCKAEKVSLQKEVEFIQNYIELEKIRLEDEIEVEFDIDSLNSVLIPPLLFVPLVENAFKHGLGSLPEKKRLSLTIKIESGTFVFKIENSKGLAPSSNKTSKGGIGINNVKKRLELLYPNRHSIIVEDGEKDFKVEILIFEFK